MLELNYTVGSIIDYRAFGERKLRRIVVEVRENDIKNGRPGFDGYLLGKDPDGGGVWGYDDQIVRVVEF
tara:strand:- start:300 stop:506 length:207 start_codon:yes stop_codon:yes gene_type:complete